MKKYLLILLLFLAISSFGQPAQFFFDDGQFHHITPSPDGNFYLLGSLSGQIALKKINAQADVIWEHTYPLSAIDAIEFGHRLLVLDSDLLLLIGESRNDATFSSGTGLIMMVSNTGQLIWRKEYEGVSAFFDVIPDSSNGFLVGGWFDLPGSLSKGILFKISLIGDVQWMKDIEVANQTFVKRLFPTSDGNFLLVGRSNVIGAGYQGVFLRKVNTDGNEIWEIRENTNFTGETFYSNSNYYNVPLGAVHLPDGSIVLTNPDEYNSDVAFFHFSENGELLDKKIYGSPTYKEYPNSLNLLPDGGWLITGRAQKNTVPTDETGFAMRLSEGGGEVWRKYYDVDNENDRLLSSSLLPDGQFFYCGMSGNPANAWLLRAEENGNILPWKVTGKVVADLNNNCMADPGDIPIKNWFLKANNGQSLQLLQTDSNGDFLFNTDDATTQFTLLPATPTENWAICENELSVTSNADFPERHLSFVVRPLDLECALLEVSLTQPDLVRCEKSAIYVTVKNRSVGESELLLLTIDLNEELTILSASETYTQNGQLVEIELPSMAAFSEKIIAFEVQLSCDTQLGSTHPVLARISPVACETFWSGPEFEVTGHCEEEQVTFEIINTGGSEAPTTSNYRIIADDTIAINGAEIELPEGGNPILLSLPADGRTWRMELSQVSEFPRANKLAVAVVEGCGLGLNGLHSIGFQDAFRLDDQVPEESYIAPPNTTGVKNKISSAVNGLGRYHLIGDTKALEFTARVENPFPEIGNEVIFLLNFSPNLDLTTFEALAANSLVETSITETGDIRVKMPDVQLDSGAIALVRFRISPNMNTPPDAAAASLFLVEGKAIINGKGPISLSPGFLNYALGFPAEEDEYNNYTEKIFRYGGRYLDFGTTMALADDGALFLGGETSSFSDGTYYSGLLIKTSENGEADWLEAINLDGGVCIIKGIVPFPDGSCLIAGNSKLPTATTNYLEDHYPFVAKVNQMGKLLWFKRFRPGGDSYGAWVNGMLETLDGNFLIFGYSDNTGGSGNDQFYWKIDSLGETIWLTYEVITGSAFSPRKGVLLPDGGFVFMGSNQSTAVNVDVYLQKINASGEKIWSKGYNSQHGITATGIAQTEDGGFLVGGSSFWAIAAETYRTTPTFMKFNEEGDLEWEKNPIIGPFNNARIYDLIPDPNGGFFAGGEISADTVDRFDDMLLLKIDANADTVWMKNYGAKNTEWVQDMLLLDNGQLVLWGYNQSRPPAYDLQAILVLADTTESPIVGTQEKILKASHRTLVYPNPVNHKANIILSPPPQKQVQWNLLDLHGRIIKQGNTRSGLFEISVVQLESGIYFLTFSQSDYPPIRLMVSR